MKRFGFAVTLLACCLLVAPSAFAINAIDLNNAAAGVGGTAVVGVSISNDVELQSFVVPLVLTSTSGGAFYTAVDTLDFSIRSNPPGGATNFFNETMVDNTSPDQLMVSWLKGIFGPGVPPGVDVSPSARLQFTLNASIGDFSIDTLLFPPSNTLAFVDMGGGSVPLARWTPAVVTVLANQCPDAGNMSDAGPIVIEANGGTGNNQLVNYHDVEGDAQATLQISGPGMTTAGGAWSWSPGCADVAGSPYTVEIANNDVSNGDCQPYLTFDVIVNAPPINASCGDVSVHWGANAAQAIGVNGAACPTVSAAVSSGPGAVAGLNWSYATGCADLGSTPVVVDVTDGLGNVEQCGFNLIVTNSAPTCSSPGNQVTLFGNLLSIDLNASSSGGGDGDPANISLVSVAPLPTGAQPTIAGGVFNWTPDVADAPGFYDVTYEVSDGCEAVQCAFQVEVQFEAPYEICVVDADSIAGGAGFPNSLYSASLNGRNHTVYIWSTPGKGFPDGDGGFDFLICYDPTGLVFQQAGRGPDLDPTFEYFTYRTGMFGGNCTGPCPDGFLKVLGIADMNNAVSPDPGAFELEGMIVALEFYVTADRDFIGTCLEVGFCSYDCTDNVISDKDGNRVAIGNRTGGQHLGVDYDIDDCLNGDKLDNPEEKIEFCPGWICVVPPEDDRGDINLNGIANEIGDAVLYTNYFIYGGGVWDALYEDNQILASDVNADGIVLTVGDLVYLIGVITGDLDPFPNLPGTRITPFVNSVDVMTDVRTDRAVVSLNSTEDVGAALFVYNYTGTVGTPVLDESSPMKIRSSAKNGELRVLVYSFDRSTFDGTVTIPVDGNIELTEASVSDMGGVLLTVNTAARQLPTSFALNQNYPNPFNAGTVIEFALPHASDWTMNVYNVAGQLVKSFDGFSEAGYVSVAWDATNESGMDVASGVYFYKLVTDFSTATKKMMLVK